MTTIIKRSLVLGQTVTLNVPANAQLLHVGFNGQSEPTVWLMTNVDDIPENQIPKYDVTTVLDTPPPDSTYLGTIDNTPIVMHVFWKFSGQEE